MKRFYYISDDLDDLVQIEHELEAGGIARPQIYLLSNDDVGLDNHDVNRVASFMKTDVIHSGEIGAACLITQFSFHCVCDEALVPCLEAFDDGFWRCFLVRRCFGAAAIARGISRAQIQNPTKYYY